MAAEEGHHDTGSYVLHHLTNLSLDLQSMTILTGDDPRGAGFWVLNLDSCLFSVLLGVIFAGLFWNVARKASAAHPTQGQNLIEKIGRAPVHTPGTNAQFVCSPILEIKNNIFTK